MKAKDVHAAIRAYYFTIDRNAVAAALQALIVARKLIIEESRNGSATTRQHYPANQA